MNKLTGGKMIALMSATALTLVGCGSSSTSSTSHGSSPTGSNSSSAIGVTPTTIKLGFVSSITGDFSSSFDDSPGGAEARIDLQNAEGGVDGRKIELITADDQSSTTQDETAVENLEAKGMFGLIDDSPLAFGGDRYLQQEGVPVTGDGTDGPEWGEEPYSNMFATQPVESSTPFGGSYYYYNYTGKFLKQIGVTKVAGISYANSPGSESSVKGMLAAANSSGISTCYDNTSVQFTAVDFTPEAIAMKSAGCNGVVNATEDITDIGLAEGIKNEGSFAKIVLGGTGYDQTVLDNPSAVAAMEGQYVGSVWVLFDPNIPAVKTMLNALSKYDKSYKAGTLPDYGTWTSYLAADLMIKGLEVAGKNPTRESFISHLRQVTSYNGGGLTASPIGFTNFGTVQMLPKTSCSYFVRLKNGSFVNAESNGKPVCGTLTKVP